MFSRKSLPVGTLFIVLVIMLALLGVGYALWSDILFIDGTVETGDVNAELSFHGDIVENDHGKEVGNCSASLSDMNQDGENELHISVTDGYPSYECWVRFDVHSVGSVPIHIYQPEIFNAPPVEHVTVGIDGCYDDDTQLHFNEEAYCTIYIHVEQDAIQNHTYTFSAEVETRQFNEPRPSMIRVESYLFNFSGTGWAGWSCPADHPYVVGGGPLTCTELFGYEGQAKPGAVTTTSPVYTYPDYPHWCFSPNQADCTLTTTLASRYETGYVVQNGGTSQSCQIYVDCSNVP